MGNNHLCKHADCACSLIVYRFVFALSTLQHHCYALYDYSHTLQIECNSPLDTVNNITVICNENRLQGDRWGKCLPDYEPDSQTSSGSSAAHSSDWKMKRWATFSTNVLPSSSPQFNLLLCWNKFCCDAWNYRMRKLQWGGGGRGGWMSWDLSTGEEALRCC